MKLPPLPSLPDRPAVTVVVPARDAAGTLPQAVGSALRQTHGGPLDVVIAVAPSSDDTAATAAELARDGRVKVVGNPAGSTPAGLNAALAVARGQVIARLDAHAVLPSGYVERAVDTLRRTGAANVGGMQVPVAPGGFAAAVAAAMSSPLGSGGARYRMGGKAGDVDTVYLGVFRAEALEAVGGFDERLARNQDYELNYRLRAAGGRVYFDPRLAVRYRPRDSLRALARQYLEYGAWKRHVVGLHPRSLRLRQLLPPAFLVGVVLVVAGSLVTGTWWLAGLVVAVGTVASLAGAAHAALTYDPPIGQPPSRRRLLLALPAIAVALVTIPVAWGVGFVLGGAVRR